MYTSLPFPNFAVLPSRCVTLGVSMYAKMLSLWARSFMFTLPRQVNSHERYLRLSSRIPRSLPDSLDPPSLFLCFFLVHCDDIVGGLRLPLAIDGNVGAR